MKETRPKCDPNGVYIAKQVCIELGVCYKTLREYRKRGYITPTNPGNRRRPKYLGQSIINCWITIVSL